MSPYLHLDALATASGVNRRTILRFEQQEATTRPRTLAAIRHAFEAAGVRFADKGGVYPPA